MQRIISYTFLSFLILLLVYLYVSLAPVEFLPSSDRERIITQTLSGVAREGWLFLKPLLQLAVMVLILEYIVAKFSGGGSLFKLPQVLDMRSLLALIVVVAFAIAALSGSETASMLKDAALVIIGFYFGRTSAFHSTEIKTDETSQKAKVDLDPGQV